MADIHAASRTRKRLLLMRHGEVRYYSEAGERVADFDAVALTARGLEQAKAVGQLLAEVPVDLAFHTPLPRTAATLAAVLGDREVPTEALPELREAGHGPFLEDPQALLDRFVYGLDEAGRPGALFAGGESLAGVYLRVTGAVEQLFRRPGWRTALIVAHGIANRAALAWACGAGLKGLAGFEQDAGCLNIIDADVEPDGRIRRRLLRLVNMTPYAPAKAGMTLTTLEEAVAPRFRPSASDRD